MSLLLWQPIRKFALKLIAMKQRHFAAPRRRPVMWNRKHTLFAFITILVLFMLLLLILFFFFPSKAV